jgi:4-amino-4-deoxy-L-arabinose transferase-like glycosyltransferase
MQKQIKQLIILFWGIVLSRILLMIYLPLTDTTEARYANIALIMSKTKDWITPYFDYGVPYWGKPPLAFWFEALSYDIFGIHDFTPRVPSLIITLLTAWIIYKLMLTLKDKTIALLAIIIYFSSFLVYALAGAVLLDPYLTFATTLSFASFIMLLNGHKNYWGYLFFIGLGIGLLAKGPLAIVLVGGTIFIWILFSFKKRVKSLLLLPWLSGLTLMLLIALPWYILAENKTPGFLHYFIIGEHFDRFLDPGWKGDLYGTAHHRPKGTVWLMWLYCSLPWGVIGIWLVVKNLFNKTKAKIMLNQLKRDDIFFYLIWMLFPMLFFTPAANVTETYLLYGFPALGILFAIYYNSLDVSVMKQQRKLFLLSAIFVPLIGFFGAFYVIKNAPKLKTEKFLIQKYYNLAKDNTHIYFLNSKEFSETYYMNKKISPISIQELKKITNDSRNKRYFIVVQNGNDNLIKQNFKNYKTVYKSTRHTLFEHNPEFK